MDTQSVQAILSLKDSGYTKGMKQAIAASEELERQTGRLSDGMNKFAVASAAGNIAARAVAKGFEMITAAVGGAVSRLDTMHNYPRVLESLGYSAEEAQKSMEYLSGGIEALPTTLDGIISSAQTLTASLGDLESGTKTAVALNDMFLAGGQGAEAASRAMVQYNQILAKGKVDMQSWNSMVEVAPGQLAQLAQSLLGAGASQRDLYAALQDGTLSVQDLNDAVIQLDQQGGEGFSSFHDQALAATGGIGTAWTNVQTAVVKGVANVIDAFDQAAQAAGLPGISEGLEMAKQAVNAFFDVLAKVVGGITSAVAPVFKFLGDHIQAVGTAAAAAAAGFVAFKVVNQAKTWIDKFGTATKDAVKRLDAYKSAIDKHGSVSKSVEAAEKARTEATKLTAEADKKAKAATEAAKRAEELREKASKAEEKALKGGATASQAKTAAEKAQKKATQQSEAAEKLAKEAEEARTKATQAATGATLAEGTAEAASNAQITAKDLLLGVLSGKYSIVTAGQMAFNAAMEANPIGLVITAISGLISVISLLSGALGGGSEEFKEAKEAHEEFMSSVKEHSQSFNKTVQDLKNAEEASDKYADETRELTDKIFDLAEASKNANDQEFQAYMEEMDPLIDQVNGRVEDLNLSFDEQSRTLNKTEEEVIDYIDAWAKAKKLEAIAEHYNTILEEGNQLTSDRIGLSKKLEAAEKLQKEVWAASASQSADRIAELSSECEKLGTTYAGLSDYINDLRSQLQETDNQIEISAETEREWADKVAAAEEEARAREVTAVKNAVAEKQTALDNAVSSHSMTLDQLSEKNQETVKQMADEWQGYVDKAHDMFNALSEDQEMNAQQMIDNLKKNREVITHWGDNMEALRNRFAQLGLDDAVLEQLRDLGPEGAGYVAALAAASNEELQNLVAEYGEGGAAATRAYRQGYSEEAQQVYDAVSHLVQQSKTTLNDELEAADLTQLSEDQLREIAGTITDDQEVIDAVIQMVNGANTAAQTTAAEGSSVTGQTITTETAAGISETTDAPVGAAAEMSSNIISTAQNILAGMFGVGKEGADKATSGVNAGKGEAESAANGLGSVLQSALKSTLSESKVLAIGKTVTQATAKAIVSGTPATRQAAASLGRGVTTSEAQGISSMAGTAVAAASSAANATINAMRGPLSNTYSLGIFAMQGFANGMSGMAGRVMSVAGSIASTAAATISSALKIGSPSRLMKQYGAWAGEGLALGLESANSMVTKASEALADAAAGISFSHFGNMTRYSFEGSLAIAGGDFYGDEIDSLRAEFRSLKEAILGRPIDVRSTIEVDGREFAKTTEPYITAVQESRNKTKNYIKGVR